ncbi:2TM domain-containing protein [Flavobacterium sp. F-65]|uniref:2TM domain-containing protein n=1 Tax=Flavobacterium pisciphilum TaxID=2893755 RepID=A0ABS8MRD4_9FLAO|nr:2TM domain-containing protein [Flavobacterium sp. F-65]MCC9071324.1 2TM domain-containing protein [Flavobacterium sp. F-65]
MGRLRRHMFEDYTGYNETPTNDERYNLAYRRVKRIKGFYSHLMIYILVNIFILIPSTNQGIFGNEEFWRWDNFSTTLFWGIGLAIHAISVFGRDLFFSVNWEERKIKEYMEKEANQKWE